MWEQSQTEGSFRLGPPGDRHQRPAGVRHSGPTGEEATGWESRGLWLGPGTRYSGDRHRQQESTASAHSVETASLFGGLVCGPHCL